MRLKYIYFFLSLSINKRKIFAQKWFKLKFLFCFQNLHNYEKKAEISFGFFKVVKKIKQKLKELEKFKIKIKTIKYIKR